MEDYVFGESGSAADNRKLFSSKRATAHEVEKDAGAREMQLPARVRRSVEEARASMRGGGRDSFSSVDARHSASGLKAWLTGRNRSSVERPRGPADSVRAAAQMLGSAGPHPNPVLERFRRAVRKAYVAYRMSAKLRTLRDMFADIQLDPDRIKPVKVLGKGGFGMVHLIEYEKTNGAIEMMAIKMLRSGTVDSTALQDFVNEVALLKKLRHPNIVQFKGIGTFTGELLQVHELTRVKMCDVFLGQEYCAGGTLKNLIVRYQANKEGRLYTWETAFRLLRDVASGLDYLHQREPTVIHRDMKPDNVLLTDMDPSAAHAKITDFGLSKTYRRRSMAEDRARKAEGSHSGGGLLTATSLNNNHKRSDPVSTGTLLHPKVSLPKSPSSRMDTPYQPGEMSPVNARTSLEGRGAYGNGHLGGLQGDSGGWGLPGTKPGRVSKLDEGAGAANGSGSAALGEGRGEQGSMEMQLRKGGARNAVAPMTPSQTTAQGRRRGSTDRTSRSRHNPGLLQVQVHDPAAEQPARPRQASNAECQRSIAANAVASGPMSPTHKAIIRRISEAENKRMQVAGLPEGLWSGLNELWTSLKAASTADYAPLNLTGLTGSLMYMAPEVYRKQPYNEKEDIFSFGIIAYELLSHKLLVSSLPRVDLPGVMEHAEKVSLGWRPEIPSTWPLSVKRLLQKCWSPEPRERPPFDAVVRMIDAIVMTGDVRWYVKRHETGGCCRVM